MSQKYLRLSSEPTVCCPKSRFITKEASETKVPEASFPIQYISIPRLKAWGLSLICCTAVCCEHVTTIWIAEKMKYITK